MKYLIVLVAIICMSSCTSVPNKSNILEVDKNQYKILLIDNCEYVYVSGLYGGMLTLKGNCKNPIHIYRSVK